MGDSWRYYLPPARDAHDANALYVAFLWNSEIVRAIDLFPVPVPEWELAGNSLFDRTPVVGYFETLPTEEDGNDFLIVNVHLASGQDNDENHLIAITYIEHVLDRVLAAQRVAESDRIVLGDFNDNPYARYESGTLQYSDALYRHMEHKGYVNFVTEDFPATRMDQSLTSVIDHVLVHRSARRHVLQERKAEILIPAGGANSFSQWRRTYSDHFPVSIDIEVGPDDDVDWSD